MANLRPGEEAEKKPMLPHQVQSSRAQEGTPRIFWEPSLPHGRYLGSTKLMMKEKEESEKVGLKLNIQKTKIMASGPISSRQIDGETVETVADFILGGFKITADGDCSHELKRCLLLGRKAMTNLDSILESRDITLPTKVRLVKAMVFPVVMYHVSVGL